LFVLGFILVLVLVLFIVMQSETRVKQVGINQCSETEAVHSILTLLCNVNNQFSTSHMTQCFSCSLQDMTVKFQKHTPIQGHPGFVTFFGRPAVHQTARTVAQRRPVRPGMTQDPTPAETVCLPH